AVRISPLSYVRRVITRMGFLLNRAGNYHRSYLLDMGRREPKNEARGARARSAAHRARLQGNNPMKLVSDTLRDAMKDAERRGVSLYRIAKECNLDDSIVYRLDRKSTG